MRKYEAEQEAYAQDIATPQQLGKFIKDNWDIIQKMSIARWKRGYEKFGTLSIDDKDPYAVHKDSQEECADLLNYQYIQWQKLQNVKDSSKS